MFVVKSNGNQYSWPRVFFTSERLVEFFNLALSANVNDVAMQLEAYCISGAQGTIVITFASLSSSS